ncbi:MAG: hypothetical protein ICV54_30645 [Nostoc sp. C3-bin3]|nr:hypothetical protein [Nostoc sp. C3-bin3]
MERRNIPQALVESVLNASEQVVSEKEGRKVYQSKIDFGSGKREHPLSADLLF